LKKYNHSRDQTRNKLLVAVSEIKLTWEQRAEGDVARVLSKSGVVITTSGISGSATNIIIRGYT
jgi:hypothetical protein